MFFEKIKDAKMYCSLENIRTHKLHEVVKCNKYQCSVEGDIALLPGYTVQLITKAVQLITKGK